MADSIIVISCILLVLILISYRFFHRNIESLIAFYFEEILLKTRGDLTRITSAAKNLGFHINYKNSPSSLRPTNVIHLRRPELDSLPIFPVNQPIIFTFIKGAYIEVYPEGNNYVMSIYRCKSLSKLLLLQYKPLNNKNYKYFRKKIMTKLLLHKILNKFRFRDRMSHQGNKHYFYLVNKYDYSPHLLVFQYNNSIKSIDIILINDILEGGE